MGGTEDKSARRNKDEDFLDRWSRRKLADNGDEAMDSPRPAPLATGSNQQEVETTLHTEPPPQLTDADMPPLDSLDADSDFSVFMSPGVSEQLRTLALRKLFHLPAFNITDGLNDYDEDYTRFAGLGNVVTQEMKRMLQRELAAEKLPEDEAGHAAQTQEAVLPADGVAENIEPGDDDPAETV